MPTEAGLYPEHRSAWIAAQMYGLRCLAHRLRSFGWEPIVARLDERQLRILATLVHEPLASACRAEADKQKAGAVWQHSQS